MFADGGMARCCGSPGESAFLRGVTSQELGDAAATRLSTSSQPGGSGGARVFDRGASLEDTIKQQAATIHAQALKLYQLQVRLFHSLLLCVCCRTGAAAAAVAAGWSVTGAHLARHRTGPLRLRAQAEVRGGH